MPPGGYAWWYIDAASDDGRHGLSIIAFVGSVFSPYYALLRRTSPQGCDPENHVALNIALYGADGYRWAMTERGAADLKRDQRTLQIGPSVLSWNADGALRIQFDEIGVPIPRRVRGEILVEPVTENKVAFELDAEGHHLWQPIAPLARITVKLEDRTRNWRGIAYVDHNRGAEPLSAAFKSWSWSRTIEADRTRIFYDTNPRNQPSRHLHLCFPSNPPPVHETVGPLTPYARSAWRLPLAARSDPGTTAKHVETWEDGPFYARNLIEHQVTGKLVRSVHEVVSLERFDMPLVQAMLPFRMPRRTKRMRSTK